MAQPAHVQTLSDAERTKILDRKITQIRVNSPWHKIVKIEAREPHKAIVQIYTQPLTKLNHFVYLVLTCVSFGLGLILWALAIHSRRPAIANTIPRTLYEVLPTGEIKQIALDNYYIVRN